MSTDPSLLPTDAVGHRAALARLLPVLGRQRPRVALTVVVAAGHQLFGIAVAVAAAVLTGRAAAGAGADEIWPLLGLLLGCVALYGLFAWAEMWLAHDLAYRVMVDLRGDVFDGLERLAPGWLLGRRSGDLAATAVSDIEAMEWFYAHTVAQVAVTLVIPPSAVIVLATIDARLALALVPFALAIVTVPLWLARMSDRQGRRLRDRLGALHAHTAEGVAGLRELTLFGRGADHNRRLHRAGRRLERAQIANGVRVGAENAATEALLAGGMVTVLATGAVLVSRGELAASTYPVAVIIAIFSLMPISQITGGIRNLGVLRAAASRVFTVTDTPPHVADRPDAAADAAGLPARVAFREVHFSYGVDRPPVLSGVSFVIEPGETVALVGPSGAGKSTCANLLMRFWDPDSGAILLGGRDLRTLTQAAVRERVALVPQDGYLFNATIAANIHLGDRSAGDDDVRRAAGRALVDEFADRLEAGLETEVGERGAALSGGQRQRIALARVLLRDPAVLILDEAVSNIDAESEVALRRALEAARAGRTTLVIAHRLSTIQNADRVVVLDRGRVVAQGPHRDLLDASPVYRALLAGQLEGA